MTLFLQPDDEPLQFDSLHWADLIQMLLIWITLYVHFTPFAMGPVLGGPLWSKSMFCERPAPPVASRNTPQCARILLADDNPVNRTLAIRLLERAGHRVVPAVDGRDVPAGGYGRYISKPIKLDELLSVISEVLAKDLSAVGQ